MNLAMQTNPHLNPPLSINWILIYRTYSTSTDSQIV